MLPSSLNCLFNEVLHFLAGVSTASFEAGFLAGRKSPSPVSYVFLEASMKGNACSTLAGAVWESQAGTEDGTGPSMLELADRAEL